jgi:hypothetical protein
MKRPLLDGRLSDKRFANLELARLRANIRSESTDAIKLCMRLVRKVEGCIEQLERLRKPRQQNCGEFGEMLRLLKLLSCCRDLPFDPGLYLTLSRPNLQVL